MVFRQKFLLILIANLQTIDATIDISLCSWPFVHQVQCYNPDSDQWTMKASLPSPNHCTSADTVEGKMYVVGERKRAVIPNLHEVKTKNKLKNWLFFFGTHSFNLPHTDRFKLGLCFTFLSQTVFMPCVWIQSLITLLMMQSLFIQNYFSQKSSTLERYRSSRILHTVVCQTHWLDAYF